ncbi:glyoxalase/bleomycin resistance protein/dioxygenase [Jannaschia sp. CCS1]|uniref:glyoxalase/bleomycin resistance protein/dioxygenase n=1 Tax=Jannaschia sp. (strain CCS1) TaxID=290400 RepID=UPI000053D65A|nr:glyoxalase/bleomycin resistance protein/dioxygenase [Jannaschia sp. CCS1]ABD55628.1 glyoxalase/bleomycin resistance protein/dioxygenase [Jannaschia sp. CCS1]
MITGLDHINLQTVQLAAMVKWYDEVMHLHPGKRPAFPFDGAWLYAGDRPVIHVVEVADAPPPAADLALEHVAFRASGLPAFVRRLREGNHRHRLVQVPGVPIVQVNVWDPDGNHLHVDFDAAEADGQGFEIEPFRVSKIEA